MKYYYMIFQDSDYNDRKGFIITFDEMFSKEGRHPNQRFIHEYEIIWKSISEHTYDSWVNDVIFGGMSLDRVFGPDRYRELIKWWFEHKDEY